MASIVTVKTKASVRINEAARASQSTGMANEVRVAVAVAIASYLPTETL